MDRPLQYQASSDSAGHIFFYTSIEHGVEAAAIQPRSNNNIRDIPKTISTNIEHVGDEFRASQNTSVALMSLKRKLAVKECNKLMQLMLESRIFLERYSTEQQKMASVAKFHKE